MIVFMKCQRSDTLRKYKYIQCRDIAEYGDWEIVQIIPSETKDYVVLMKEDKPIQDYIKLHDATNEELIKELIKRLEKGDPNV